MSASTKKERTMKHKGDRPEPSNEPETEHVPGLEVEHENVPTHVQH